MPITYNDLYLDLRQMLVKNGISQASLEAREIVSFVSGKTREEFFRDARIYVRDGVEDGARALLRRRLEGEPLAYITGEWEFMGAPLSITSDVLIPRPETETLTEEAIRLLRGLPEPRLLDLGTGSGCIGIAAALALPELQVVLADVSAAALAVARQNIRRHGLGARVATVRADALRPAPLTLGIFDVIAFNPPYIKTGDLYTLDTSVHAYEPLMALDGGEDGLDYYRAAASGYKHALKRDGALVCEFGLGQADAVCDILLRSGYAQPDLFDDLSGRPRIACTHVAQSGEA